MYAGEFLTAKPVTTTKPSKTKKPWPKETPCPSWNPRINLAIYDPPEYHDSAGWFARWEQAVLRNNEKIAPEAGTLESPRLQAASGSPHLGRLQAGEGRQPPVFHPRRVVAGGAPWRGVSSNGTENRNKPTSKPQASWVRRCMRLKGSEER